MPPPLSCTALWGAYPLLAPLHALDQRVVNIGSFALSWIRSLFSDRLITPVALSNSEEITAAAAIRGDDFEENADEVLGLLDWILVSDDRLLPVFLSLVMLVEHRAMLLQRSTRDEIEAYLTTDPESPYTTAPVIPPHTERLHSKGSYCRRTRRLPASGINHLSSTEDPQRQLRSVATICFVALPVEADELMQYSRHRHCLERLSTSSCQLHHLPVR